MLPPKHKRSTDEIFYEPQRLHTVLASCGFGSRRAMEALPAQFEGIFRKHMLVRDGVLRDSAWYSVTDKEWPVVRQNLLDRLSNLR